MKTLRALLIELEACPEARKWVGTRSFDVVWPKAKYEWRTWFAEKAYHEAVVERARLAKWAYDVAIGSAQRTYRAAVEPARRVYHAEIKSAERAYIAAVEPARRAYDVAVEPVQRALVLTVWPWLSDGAGKETP